MLVQSLLQACSVGSYLLLLKYYRATGKFKLLRRSWAAGSGDCRTSDQLLQNNPRHGGDSNAEQPAAGPPAGRRQSHRAGPGPTLQIKAVADHSWVCDGSTARVSLTATARPDSAAQLELGTPGCGRAAARRPGRGHRGLSWNFKLPFWARAAVSI